jgi:hypothetical protein
MSYRKVVRRPTKRLKKNSRRNFPLSEIGKALQGVFVLKRSAFPISLKWRNVYHKLSDSYRLPIAVSTEKAP